MNGFEYSNTPNPITQSLYCCLVCYTYRLLKASILSPCPLGVGKIAFCIERLEDKASLLILGCSLNHLKIVFQGADLGQTYLGAASTTPSMAEGGSARVRGVQRARMGGWQHCVGEWLYNQLVYSVEREHSYKLLTLDSYIQA